jgi:hypothetical protein
MSQINLEILHRERPDLRVAWERLANWFREHESLNTINPIRVAESAKVPADILAIAFFYLTKANQLAPKFRLQNSQGILIGPNSDSPDPEDFPETVPGPFLTDTVDRDSCNIVAVFARK